ncbi:MAG TPA: OmpH family outer membrane protein [Candidatus Angelobacter sp.]
MLGNAKILVLFLGLGLAGSPAGWAQAPAPSPASGPAPVKIGYVAIQAALANTNEGKKELDALQQKFSPRQAELKNQGDEIEALKKQLQTQGGKLSDEARATLVKNIETKQKTLQRNGEDFQNEVQQVEVELLNRLGEKMQKVLDTYAKANGYAVILDVSNPQTTPVLYGSPTINITKDLIDAYNAQSPVPAPAAKPAGNGAANQPPAAPSPKQR